MLFCASSTTIFAISKLSALLTFLFLIFETPYLNMFGMLSIPLFISFLPTEEFIAFDPSWKPNFAKFSSSPLPDYLRFLFFVRFKITA